MMKLNNLHKNWRKAFILSACFVLALPILQSCKKKPSQLGTDALDVNDLLAAGGIDTFQLKTYTVLEDSIATDNQIFGNLGAYHDPKFGTVNASIFTRFSISGKLSLPAGSILSNIDSVVLSLNYGGYYGTLEPQTFEVYQLADIMHNDSTYYRSTNFATTGPNLVDPTSATQKPNTTTKVSIVGDTALNPQLRLRLDPTFGTQFINDIIAGNSAFENSSNFLSSNYFKGLKINVANPSPAVGKGAVLYFNLGNQQTKITIYFKLSGEATPREVALIINNGCADFNHVELDHTGYHIADVLANPLNGQTQFYSQSFNSRAVVEFPSVNNLKSNSVINNALLYLPVSYQTASYYYPSITIELGYKTDNNKIITFRTATYNNSQKAYVVDLRDYIQDIVSNKAENRGLYIKQYYAYFTCTAERLVFNGPATSYKTKPKLVIKYTEFK